MLFDCGKAKCGYWDGDMSKKQVIDQIEVPQFCIHHTIDHSGGHARMSSDGALAV